MTKRNIKVGFEFSLDGTNVYKVSRMTKSPDNFLAIWIGTYANRDMSSYNGFIRHGDFRLDQALFEIDGVYGTIKKIHNATGVKDLFKASENYVNNISW